MSDTNEPAIGRDKVVEIIHSVLEKVEAAGDVSRENVYNELRSLQDIIFQTREEIRQTGIGSLNGDHVSSATDELDAVVAATEEATETIMDSCDAIMAQSENLDGGDKDAVQSQVTKILEACTFQDITGQRITKVIKSLKTIEEKIARLLEIIPVPESSMGEDTRSGDEKLLNGPQMPDKAINQTDIDKLLADLF